MRLEVTHFPLRRLSPLSTKTVVFTAHYFPSSNPLFTRKSLSKRLVPSPDEGRAKSSGSIVATLSRSHTSSLPSALPLSSPHLNLLTSAFTLNPRKGFQRGLKEKEPYFVSREQGPRCCHNKREVFPVGLRKCQGEVVKLLFN